MLGTEVKFTDIVAKIAEKDASLASAITFDREQEKARGGKSVRHRRNADLYLEGPLEPNLYSF